MNQKYEISEYKLFGEQTASWTGGTQTVEEGDWIGFDDNGNKILIKKGDYHGR